MKPSCAQITAHAHAEPEPHVLHAGPIKLSDSHSEVCLLGKPSWSTTELSG